MSLLNRIRYIPSERNQGNCGNCWVWPSTGIMEIALNVQNGIEDRLSIQLLNSCKTDKFACCGGSIYEFATWYTGKRFAVPWANTNGFFQDGVRECDDNAPAVSCGAISTVMNYPITSIQAVTIATQGVGQATAIANIKNILYQNKGVYFSFALATQSHWNTFYDFWNHQPESALWNPDPYCGYTWVPNEGGSHAVLIVGYDDNNWIALNSWGTANGVRPNGLFRIPIYMNYDCTYYDSTQRKYYYSRGFSTLNVAFNPLPKPNLTPYKPWDWTDKVIVSKYSQAKSDSSPYSSTDALFVNWSLINNGGMAVTNRFWIEIYVDDVLKGSWYWDSLDPGVPLVLFDLWIGQLSPGTHTVKFVVDSTNTINESNEQDNIYIKTITVIGPPNLTPYKPWDWTDKVIVSKYSQAKSDSSPYSYTDGLYVNWALINNGGMAVSNRFWIEIYVDNVLKGSWYWDTLEAGMQLVLYDLWIGQLSPGTHTIKMVVDTTGTVNEFNEGDNQYVKTITVSGPPSGPDLTGEWSSVKKTCRNTQKGPSCKITGSLLVRNIGTQPVSSSSVQFFISEHQDHVEGTPITSVSLRKINGGSSKGVRLYINLLGGETASGDYLIAVIDPANSVMEINEGNNVIVFGPIP
jgi:C1A family cysteine protease